MLSEEQKHELGEALQEAANRLLASAQQTLAQSIEGVRDEGRDSIDLSNAEELISTTLRLRDRERSLLTKIREAMERLSQDEIDECEVCGGDIGFKRLLARPVTTSCIECKERAEEEERRQGNGAEQPPEKWPQE